MFYITIPKTFLVDTRDFSHVATPFSIGSASACNHFSRPAWKKLLRKLNNNRRRAIQSFIDTLLP